LGKRALGYEATSIQDLVDRMGVELEPMFNGVKPILHIEY
jgi:hypothetical protein